ncbi:metal-dependent hydrolase [Aureicoccus marinus]|jgi:uncharacterized membrane protein YozB (DUF420 family)|uniref:Uncharacterized protein n=1 Tax=Aureicoccus marinus TaxID=754435 RepID=A0A2S7T888_9FLAO|nr:hypothetical protein [Aureicoccus marinus]PQJ16139.1 hypothetical protein BST99_10735 [Aureicoccus marinus]
MFVGHYAAAFALKGKEPSVSLGMLFIGVQLVDIFFFPFALYGIESLHFEDSHNQVNNFVMEFPYTHGLLASIVWSLAFILLYLIWPSKKKKTSRIALFLGLSVVSHWFVDLLVHTPDLPLVHGDPKYGFGLWQNKHMAFSAELSLLVVCWCYYFFKSQAKSKSRQFFMVLFLLFLIAVNTLNFYVLPASENLEELTINALAAYFILALLAGAFDLKRKEKKPATT